MKIYFHMNIENFSNCYLIVNEISKLAIIIDPGKINEKIINQIEDDGYELCAVLITHNHPGNVHGLKTLRRIYDVDIYAADGEVAEGETNVIKGEGVLRIAGLDIVYFALPGHAADSIVYKIGTVLFTGDSLTAGAIGETTSSYAKTTLINGIKSKIFSHQDDTIIMPGHGPLTSVGAEKKYNLDLNPPPKKNGMPARLI
ncbi:MAG: MBL fold metallo-hydrolase [Treponema sp.]|nr:MBL fold metallo-hydrolase [Treponema sp.]